jgi:hypothetical protein
MTTKDNTSAAGGGGGADRLSPQQRKELDEWLAKPPPPMPEPKPKAVFVEVSPRMHAAVRARPEKLRLIAEDADGNAVFEKPAAAGNARDGAVKWGEPLSEAEVGTDAYNRLRAQPGRNRPPPHLEYEPEPVRASAGTPAAAVYGGGAGDQRWKAKRGWDGETRYVPDARGSRDDALVVSDYDIFAVLKE